MTTGKHIRMARQALDLGVIPFSDLVSYNKATIILIEKGKGRANTIAAIQSYLESRGVEFIPENGGGIGIRLAKNSEEIIKILHASSKNMHEVKAPSRQAIQEINKQKNKDIQNIKDQTGLTDNDRQDLIKSTEQKAKGQISQILENFKSENQAQIDQIKAQEQAQIDQIRQ